MATPEQTLAPQNQTERFIIAGVGIVYVLARNAVLRAVLTQYRARR